MYSNSVHRASNKSDADFFRNDPDAAWRLTIRPFNRDYFTFKIATRDGSRVCTGDRWDISARMDRYGGSPLERLRRAVRYLLADQNRTRRVRTA